MSQNIIISVETTKYRMFESQMDFAHQESTTEEMTNLLII